MDLKMGGTTHLQRLAPLGIKHKIFADLEVLNSHRIGSDLLFDVPTKLIVRLVFLEAGINKRQGL
jgi:hypothetical protein